MPVGVGTPLIDIISQDTFRILTRVEEIDLHLLREGMPVQITGNRFAELELMGHIAAIGMQGNVDYIQQAGAKFDITIGAARLRKLKRAFDYLIICSGLSISDINSPLFSIKNTQKILLT